jgi:exopolysaccharide production protein ExoQ
MRADDPTAIQQPPPGVERVLATGCMVALSGALTPVFAGPWPDDIVVDGMQPNRAWWVIFHFLVLALIARRLPEVMACAARMFPVVLLVGLAIASTLWSLAPEQTLFRSAALVSTTFFGMYLAVILPPAAWYLTLRRVVLVLIIINFAAVVLAPDLAVMTGKHAGAWRGMMPHKNHLGPIAALATLVLSMSLVFRLGRSIVNVLGLALAIGLLLGSRSFSSLVIVGTLALAAAAVALWKSARLKGGLSVAFALSLVCLICTTAVVVGHEVSAF